ncbi:four-carbon acid sugar kinase family protein [Brachybacterium nesterenkovii]|uniref:four-carbon acid sugar kinase family protein n=1 Tax=Brachybacterium nesterenkovii TaxID=47847 RepID=UPI003219A808
MRTDRRLLVLDDDPTGSQCVADVDIVLDADPATAAAALAEPGSTCFVLTNTRALDEADAVALNRRILEGVIAAGVDPATLHVVSRSDSTLRGHVIAEPAALAAVLAEHGRDVDAILLCPAMIEAGRFTRDGVHYATVDGEAIEVGATDFARDATFGYASSDLAAFLAERSGGNIREADVLRVTLEDIRTGGVDAVAGILGAARDAQWAVIDATEYTDMEVVAQAVARLEQQGRTILTRCAPSFVRPLAGQSGARVLADEDIPVGGADRLPHGLVVVGSHVGLTTQQLAVVQERSGLVEVELAVSGLLDEARRESVIVETARRIREALQASDVVLYTSRELVRTDDPAASLAIARTVSDAVVDVVSRVRDARPAWVVAKGGITSHEVAEHGLGIVRARVAGQFYAGQISLFTPVEAPDEVLGMPYVVFPGNVGGREALADVVARLAAATASRTADPAAAEPAVVDPAAERARHV